MHSLAMKKAAAYANHHYVPEWVDCEDSNRFDQVTGDG